MKKWEVVIAVIGIFLCGVIANGNLIRLRYGVPEHYGGQWWKIALAIFLATIIGIKLINHTKEEK